MPLQIIRNDITRVAADALVNCANPEPVIGAGSDWAMYQAAGQAELLAARRAVGPIAPGHAAATPAFALPAKYILHAVGPVWQGGDRGEREILRACYDRSLALAEALGCASVAFPLLGAGSNGFPKELALKIATAAMEDWLRTRDTELLLVVFDRRSVELSEARCRGIERYIDEHYAREQHRKEHAPALFRNRREARREKAASFDAEADVSSAAMDFCEGSFSAPMAMGLPKAAAAPNLDELLTRREDTFQQRLLRLIDERGLDDVTVYKRANISRQVFSSIRKNRDYQPKKTTALAFAIALRLDLSATRDLLSRAGMALSPSSKFDLIVEYFISEGNYDIFDLNNALFHYDQPTLGV